MPLLKSPLYQAELYSKVNELQLSLEPLLLKRYQNFIKWRNGGEVSVLDVGSGTGCSTVKVLRPLLPENFKELIGLDCCPDMHNFSKLNYEDEKTKFLLQDIVDDIPRGLIGRFDHIFSLLCFHVVQDHKRAFENLYSLLQPGGSIFIVFMIRHPLHEVYEHLVKNEKWADYMEDVQQHVCPFLHSKNPEKECSEIAESAGFKVTCCEVSKESHLYPNRTSLKSFLSSVSTFMTRIPQELHDDFLDEVMEIITENNFIEVLNDKQIRTHFTVIVLTGEKEVDRCT